MTISPQSFLWRFRFFLQFFFHCSIFFLHSGNGVVTNVPAIMLPNGCVLAHESVIRATGLQTWKLSDFNSFSIVLHYNTIYKHIRYFLPSITF